MCDLFFILKHELIFLKSLHSSNSGEPLARWARCIFPPFLLCPFFHVCTFTPFLDIRPLCFPFHRASFCPCYVSRFSFISLCLSFSLFRWPRPWPYLALLYLTLPSQTFLNPNSKKGSINTDFQQRSDPRSSCPPNRLIISKSIQVFSCRHRVQVVIPKVPCVCDVCVVKARTWIGRVSSVHGGLRIQRRCQ